MSVLKEPTRSWLESWVGKGQQCKFLEDIKKEKKSHWRLSRVSVDYSGGIWFKGQRGRGNECRVDEIDELFFALQTCSIGAIMKIEGKHQNWNEWGGVNRKKKRLQ